MFFLKKQRISCVKEIERKPWDSWNILQSEIDLVVEDEWRQTFSSLRARRVLSDMFGGPHTLWEQRALHMVPAAITGQYYTALHVLNCCAVCWYWKYHVVAAFCFPTSGMTVWHNIFLLVWHNVFLLPCTPCSAVQYSPFPSVKIPDISPSV